MTRHTSARLTLVSLAAGLALVGPVVSSQAPAGAPPQAQVAPGGGGRGGGGRGGGLPGATPDQLQALAEMVTTLAPLTSAATTARNELALATFADPASEAGVRTALEKLRAAELALATRRAEAFERVQAGPHRLNAEQVTALIAAGGNVTAGGRGAPGAGPGRGRGN